MEFTTPFTQQNIDHRVFNLAESQFKLNKMENENGMNVKMLLCITAQKFTDFLIDLEFFIIIYSKFLVVHYNYNALGAIS